LSNHQDLLKSGEVLSFATTAVVMLSSSIFFPDYYWLFIFLALIDGTTTSLRSERVLTLDRIFFALVVLVLGSFATGFDILAMILETATVIVILDLLFLIRKYWTRSRADFLAIVFQRFRSYAYSLLPAVVFSAGLIYLGSVSIGARLGQSNAILEVGIASIGVFLIILFAARQPANRDYVEAV
jgi:hypothetical protein